MSGGQGLENLIPARSEEDVNLPPIFRADLSREKIVRDQPIHKADSAVVRDLEPFRKFPNGDPISAGEALHSE
jgi:hypothetical protein